MKIIILFCFLISFSFNAVAELKLYYQASGTITVSVNGVGTNDQIGTMVIKKPEGALVRKVFVLAASNSQRTIKDKDISINGKEIFWDKSVFNSVPNIDGFFHNVISDATDIFKDIINNESAGDIVFSTSEVDTTTIDGVILVVIFNDPSINLPRSVSIFFGDQSTGGDEFFVSFKDKLTEIPEIIDFGLGISFGFQGVTGTNMVNLVDIKGERLTSSAGGEDDGASFNGALLTVGGVGDSNTNPLPFAGSTGSDTDDELYDLRDFLSIDDDGFILKSTNPSDDDNIFFAYLYSSVRTAALPPVPPPKDLSVENNRFIDIQLPTIVLIHGLSKKSDSSEGLGFWTGFEDTQAGGLITNDIGDDVNIIQYIWEDAFHVNGTPNQKEYTAASNVTYNAGVNLAKQLIELLGKDYSKKIHFVGHSLGTIVSTYAISALHDGNKNIKDIQFTALDRPDHVTNISGITDKEEKTLGYHKDFFVLNLPFDKDDLTLKLDNYYVKPGAFTLGVGDIAFRTSATQNIYNWFLVSPDDVADEIGLDTEGIENDHSGVHQWYRWSIDPNGFNDKTYCSGNLNQTFKKPFFIDETLDPCIKGWLWSINKDYTKFPSSNAQIINKTDFKEIALISDITDFGCVSIINITSFFVLSCMEQSSPFSVATITIPENTTHISFDYSFDNRGDGDYAAILIDGKEIWKMSGSSVLDEGVFYNTGALPINIDSGERNITIALYGVGEKNAEFMIQNIVLHTIQSEVLDGDIDGDDVEDTVDNCPAIPNPDQEDTDSDGQGDACDTDDDDDSILDGVDNCQYTSNFDQSDIDEDGKGDVCDEDLDGDNVDNDVDNCPTIANESQLNWDNNDYGDACDPDVDGDTVANGSDICPFTELGEIVNSGNGCTISQLCPCEGPRGTVNNWRNHGKYVSCTAKTSENFLDQGLITEEEKDAIVSEAAGSECGVRSRK